jgi:ribosomal protein L19
MKQLLNSKLIQIDAMFEFINNYFKKNIALNLNKNHFLKIFMSIRKNRLCISLSLNFKKINVGDIIELIFKYKNLPITFSGIIIAIKKKAFKVADVMLIVRNILMKIGIEVMASYYYNRLYRLKILDYKRKAASYVKNKLYFLR